MATTTLPPSRRVPRAALRRRGVRLALALAVLAVAGVAFAVVTRAGGGDGITGNQAPSFSLPDVRDPTVVTLPAGRPVVVNFFAAWCVPCRAEMPLLERASRRAAGAVAFVGVDVNDSRSAASDLLAEVGITYPAGYDPERTVAGRYRLQGMPTTVFIEADGRVAGVARGALSEAELDDRLGRLQRTVEVGTP